MKGALRAYELAMFVVSTSEGLFVASDKSGNDVRATGPHDALRPLELLEHGKL